MIIIHQMCELAATARCITVVCDDTDVLILSSSSLCGPPDDKHCYHGGY